MSDKNKTNCHLESKGSVFNILLKLLNLDLAIDVNIFHEVGFRDNIIEKLFSSYETKEFTLLKPDHLILAGWTSIVFYVYFIYYHKAIVTICIILMSISLLLIIIKNNYATASEKAFINYILSFSITLFLNFKAIYLLNIEETPNTSSEILRTVIFDFVSSNILMLLILDDNPYIRIIFFIFNQTTIFYSIHKDDKKFCNIVDAIVSFIYFFVFYLLKKIWEHNKRNIFSRDYCLDKLLNYTSNLLRELNGFHVVVSSRDFIISGKNTKELFTDYIENSDDNEFKDEKSDYPMLPKEMVKYNMFLERLTLHTPVENIEYIDRNHIREQERNDSRTINNILNSAQNTSNLKQTNNSNRSNNELNDNLNTTTLLSVVKKLKYLEFSNSFIKLGIFETDIKNSKTYYEVFYRRYQLTKKSMVDDFYYYDITNIIDSQIETKKQTIAKQRLYAKVSHEFKTPINSIISLIDTVKLNLLDQELINNHLTTSRNLLSYLIFLTEDIIQFSNINDIRNVKINNDVIDVKEIILFCFNILNSLMQSESAKIGLKTSYYYDKMIDNVIAKSDEVRLKQILLIFVANAMKFTMSGEIKISAEYSDEMTEVIEEVSNIFENSNDKSKLKINSRFPNNTSDNNIEKKVNNDNLVNTDKNWRNSDYGTIILSVTDTGTGMTNSNLFFEKLDYTNLNNVDQNTIGLMISKSLADCLNIKLTCKSRRNNGTKFSISIPCLKQTKRHAVRNHSTRNIKINRLSDKLVPISSRSIIEKDNNSIDTSKIFLDLSKSLTNVSDYRYELIFL